MSFCECSCAHPLRSKLLFALHRRVVLSGVLPEGRHLRLGPGVDRLAQLPYVKLTAVVGVKVREAAVPCAQRVAQEQTLNIKRWCCSNKAHSFGSSRVQHVT